MYTFPWDGITIANGEIICTWTGAAPDGACWIGLGNFTRGRWDWVSTAGGLRATVDNVLEYVSPADTFLIIVLMTGTTQATLDTVSFNIFFPAILTLLSEPEAGEGTAAAPYQQNIHETIFLSLFAPAELKDVSSDPRTQWVVSPPTAGSIVGHISRASLHIADGFTGAFSIGAIFDGYPSEPDRIYFTTVDLGQVENVLPDAVLYAEPLAGSPPLSVSFDARDSNDVDGEIVSYRYDFDGDGTYDLSGMDRTATHEYAAAGTYTARLEVTDDRDGVDTATVQVSVTNETAQWHFVKVREALDGERSQVGESCDIWDVGGFPAIVYTDFSTVSDAERMHFIRAADANGASWGEPKQLRLLDYDSESTGINVQLRMISDRPAVAYCEHNWDGDRWEYLLYYERAVDALGTDWSNTRVLADPTRGGVIGLHCQLLNLSGLPGISYVEGTAQALQWTTGSDADGSTFSTPLVIAAPEGEGGTYSCGEYSSLALIAGNPAVSYLGRVSEIELGYKLMYVRANDATGTAWGSQVTIRQATNIAQGTALLELPGGVPGILYENFGGSDQALLTFTSGSSAAGGTWTSGFDVMTGGYEAYFPAMDVVLFNGKPAMATIFEFGFAAADSLHFAQATAVDGSSWNSAVEIADTHYGYEMDMCLVAGKPALCYYDESGDALWYGMYY